MIYTIDMKTQRDDGVLERILRVARHRGFTIICFKVNTVASHYHIQLDVEGARPRAYLVKQLEKLLDVEHVVSAREVEYAKSA